MGCQGSKVSQASQDLRDSQDCLGPQDNMDSQELLDERGLWGCQAPLALEVCLETGVSLVSLVSLALWA